MNNKSNLNSDLKAILDEGKKSTFSLTDLFDSADFQQEKEDVNDLNESQLNNDKDDYETRKRNHESDNEDYEDKHEDDKDNHEELNELNDTKSKFKSHQEYILNLAKEETFFFEKDDTRFERLRFYDPDKIQKHLNEWASKKIQLRHVNHLLFINLTILTT